MSVMPMRDNPSYRLT